MSRNPNTSVVASPVLIGAVTVLVVVVAVMLAYNANKGLPFVPTLDVKVRMQNAEVLGYGSEVKEGGFRLGFVEKTRPVRLPDGTAAAEMEVKLDADADLPIDTTFRVRPRSPLGLKYLEVHRGESDQVVDNGHTFGAGQPARTWPSTASTSSSTRATRDALRVNMRGFGNGLAGRGESLNEAIGQLPVLFPLVESVTRNLADRRTRLGRFFTEVGRAADVVAPMATVQARLFTHAADTFDALSRDTEALKATIERTHPSLRAGTQSLPSAAALPRREHRARARDAARDPRPSPGAARVQRRARARRAGAAPHPALLRGHRRDARRAARASRRTRPPASRCAGSPARCRRSSPRCASSAPTRPCATSGPTGSRSSEST